MLDRVMSLGLALSLFAAAGLTLPFSAVAAGALILAGMAPLPRGAHPGLEATAAPVAVLTVLVVGALVGQTIDPVVAATLVLGAAVVGGTRLVGSSQRTAAVDGDHAVDEHRRVDLDLEPLAEALDAVGDAAIRTDRLGQVQWLSPRAEGLCGVKCAEVLGQPLGKVLRLSPLNTRGGGTQDAGAVVARALHRRTTVSGLSRASLQAFDGQARPISYAATPLKTDEGQHDGVLFLFRDISYETQTERDLDALQRDFHHVIDVLPDGAAVVREGELVYLNPALLQTLGAETPEPFLHRPIAELMHPEDRFRAAHLLAGAETQHELRLARADEEYATVQVSPLRRLVYEGGPAQLLCVRDVTAQRDLQGRLAVADRMATVGALSTGVAHDMKNAVTIAWNNTLLLEECLEDQLDEEASSMLHDLRGGVEVLRQLSVQLHELGRPTGGRGEADVGEVLQTVARLVRYSAQETAVIEVSVEGAPRVCVSRPTLSQILLNLLLNAIEALKASRRRDGRIQVRVSQHDYVVFEIDDNGPGIPPGAQTQIFRTFFTTRRDTGGSGVGLATVRRLCDDAGGRVQAENKPGGGARFRVELPSARPPAGKSEPSPPSERS